MQPGLRRLRRLRRLENDLTYAERSCSDLRRKCTL
jgi:hypothetical protein